MDWRNKHPSDLTPTEKWLKRTWPYLLFGLVSVPLVMALAMGISALLARR